MGDLFGGFDQPKIEQPNTIKPPPDNLEEAARQRRLRNKRRTNKEDFIIDPVDQGLNISDTTI